MVKAIQKPDPRPDPDLTRPQGQTFSQPNHVGSPSNFQDIFQTIYQHDLILHHPPSLQSGTLNVLHAQN